MAKLEDILKAQGYTEADIAAVAPLLGDAKFRGAVEQGFSGFETKVNELGSTLDSYKKENETWANWHEKEGKPLLALYEKDRADAIAEAAGLKARLKLAEQGGFAPPSPDPASPAAGQPPVNNEPFDPKKHKLVTQDDIAAYADMEGRAIAMANDLSEEYRQLTGKSILEYTTQDGEGRTLRGMSALRNEAVQAKKPLDRYVADKFDFQGKRNAVAEAEAKRKEDAIRADERTKVLAQNFNPNTRELMPSREPFIPAPREAGKMPWDVPQQERRASRLDRAMQTQIKGAVQ